MINFHFHIERWKKNKRLGVYVSTDGRVKAADKSIIKPKISSVTGYPVVKIGNFYVNVHVLVMETWRGKQEGMTIDHIDSNKRNPKLSNLEYVTEKENLARALRAAVNDAQDTIVAANENEWFISFAQKFPARVKGLSILVAAPRIKHAASQHKKYLGYLLKRYPDGKIEGVIAS